jgi:hypothetical protein
MRAQSSSAAAAWALIALCAPLALQLAGVWLAGFGLACTQTARAILSGVAAAEAKRPGVGVAAREYDGSERCELVSQ